MISYFPKKESLEFKTYHQFASALEEAFVPASEINDDCTLPGKCLLRVICLSLEIRLFNSVFGGLFVFLQVQSFTEYFQSDCTDSIAWLNGPNYFTAITEGWAAYNEYELFPNYTTLYNWDSNQQGHKDIMKQKYGMLYYQVLETVII